jgi:exodeoxyribonuclease VII small subunit
MSKIPNYEEAFEELQNIVQEIESGKISIDLLTEKVKRASQLVKICKTKLTQAEDNVKEILKDLKESDE